jgi:hypothetical protein
MLHCGQKPPQHDMDEEVMIPSIVVAFYLPGIHRAYYYVLMWLWIFSMQVSEVLEFACRI